MVDLAAAMSYSSAMTGEPLRTLFHPFETGELDLPLAGTLTLAFGIDRRPPLPDGWVSDIRYVQGFRPDFLRLQREGLTVSPDADGVGYDRALILAGRHRGQTEAWIADALTRTSPGALILVAGGRDDGIASLRKRIEHLVALDGALAKHHGTVFWFRSPNAADALAAAICPSLDAVTVDGKFQTRPGMFSHGRVDRGSALLAASLPADIDGRVADFCAGWGYLASEMRKRGRRVEAIDLYEADHAALEAARVNLAGGDGPGLGFHWCDLVSEPVVGRYDSIVMNPPFHTGRATEPDLGSQLISKAAASLRAGGRLFVVANRGLPYERTLAQVFARHALLADDGMFKVFAAVSGSGGKAQAARSSPDAFASGASGRGRPKR